MKMTKLDAKAEALILLSEWAWDMKTPRACRDHVTNDDDAKLLAEAFEDIAVSLYVRWEKLHTRSRHEYIA